MYLWKVDSLVEDFKLGRVSQKEELKYMLVATIAMAFASEPALYIGTSYNYYDTISSIIFLGISIFGVYYCYKINSSGDDKDFIVRLTCIGLPVLVRVLSVMIPLFLVSTILEFSFYTDAIDEENFETTAIQVVEIAIFLAIYYGYLSKKIKDVSSKDL